MDVNSVIEGIKSSLPNLLDQLKIFIETNFNIQITSSHIMLGTIVIGVVMISYILDFIKKVLPVLLIAFAVFFILNQG